MTNVRRRPGRPWPAGVDFANAGHYLAADAASTDADAIVTHLRRSILLGDLEPGAWLRQVDVARHYRVSRTPIREALRALEREGLVTIVPNHGARVAPLSLEDFEEIYALRSGIEGLAARKAAEVATADDHAELMRRLAALSAAARTSPLLPYLRTEWSLRLACYELTKRQRLLSTILHLRDRAERYLRYAFQVEADTRRSFSFHQTLVDAIGHNDGRLAEQTNRQALEWTLHRAWDFVQAAVEASRGGEAEVRSGSVSR